jgi:hypothetical protein
MDRPHGTARQGEGISIQAQQRTGGSSCCAGKQPHSSLAGCSTTGGVAGSGKELREQ